MRRSIKRLLRKILLGIAALYALALLLLLYVRLFPPPTTMVQVQRRVEALFAGREYEKRHDWVDLDRLPRHVWRAVVAAEDTRFFDHWGFDLEELRAVREEIERGEDPRGASTITQQLVKNLFLSTRGGLARKAVEATLTLPAEALLPKWRILELYINEIEWGPGVYGIDAAARHHYGIPARRLSREQAARLAAIIPAPLTRRPERMDGYTEVILERMRAMGW